MQQPDIQEVEQFRTLISSHEEWLMERILGYAEEYDFTRYTSTLKEAWRVSIEGLSRSLLELMMLYSTPPELHPDENYSQDPAAAFGMLEANRHRSRGVNLAMFLALFKYYRQSYHDLLQKEKQKFKHHEFFVRYIDRFFDRTEIAYCTEWAGMSSEKQILELSRTNLEMTNEKNKYLTIFDSFGSPVAVIDREGYIENFNFMAEKIFKGKEIPGKHYYQEQKVKEKFAWLQEEIAELIASNESERAFEKVYESAQMIFDVKLERLHDVSNKFVGYTVLMNDITELKNAQEKLRELDRLKSDFIASMSHELRTPMNAILGFVELMKRDPQLQPNQLESLEIVQRSGRYLLSLINDVLDMSKIEAGRVVVENQPFDFRAMIRNIEDMMQMKAIEKGLEFRVAGLEKIPAYLVGDERKLNQIIINLIGNAIKFTTRGSVEIQLSYEPGFPTARSRLICCVKDTGMGIEQAEIATIFEPFIQSKSGLKSKEGTGLGLPISKKFVELMGGTIEVTSEPQKGSSFTFEIETEEAAGEAVRDLNFIQKRVIGLQDGQPEFRILIVEDNAENRMLLKRLLDMVGFNVKEAHNGLEAIEIFENWDPHLIWMDIQMPVMNGYEATKRIKSTIKGEATIIIALTASVYDDETDGIYGIGCDNFIRKPYRESEIFEMMAKYLGVRYLYENIEDISKSESLPSVSLDSRRELIHSAVSKMMSPKREELLRAAKELDDVAIQEIIKTVDQLTDEEVAVFYYYIDSYRMDELCAVMQEVLS